MASANQVMQALSEVAYLSQHLLPKVAKAETSQDFAVYRRPGYSVHDVLHEGSKSVVVAVRKQSRWTSGSKVTGELLAAKVCNVVPKPVKGKIRRGRRAAKHRLELFIEELETEVELLRRVQHESGKHVVALKEVFYVAPSSQVWMIMEYLPVELDMYVLKRGLEPEELSIIAVQLVNALDFIHSRGVIHMDLKFENILVSAEGLKLCDFGLSMEMTEGETKIVRHVQGTTYTMAPELYIKGTEFDERVDVWALGVLLYLCTLSDISESDYLSMDETMLQRSCWRSYQKSDEEYFVTTMDEAVYGDVANKKPVPIDMPRLLTRSKRYRDAFDFCVKCLVPYPQTGTEDFPITRKVELERAKLSELKLTNLIQAGQQVDPSESKSFLKRLVEEIPQKREEAFLKYWTI